MQYIIHGLNILILLIIAAVSYLVLALNQETTTQGDNVAEMQSHTSSYTGKPTLKSKIGSLHSVSEAPHLLSHLGNLGAANDSTAHTTTGNALFSYNNSDPIILGPISHRNTKELRINSPRNANALSNRNNSEKSIQRSSEGVNRAQGVDNGQYITESMPAASGIYAAKNKERLAQNRTLHAESESANTRREYNQYNKGVIGNSTSPTDNGGTFRPSDKYLSVHDIKDASKNSLKNNDISRGYKKNQHLPKKSSRDYKSYSATDMHYIPKNKVQPDITETIVFSTDSPVYPQHFSDIENVNNGIHLFNEETLQPGDPRKESRSSVKPLPGKEYAYQGKPKRRGDHSEEGDTDFEQILPIFYRNYNPINNIVQTSVPISSFKDTNLYAWGEIIEETKIPGYVDSKFISNSSLQKFIPEEVVLSEKRGGW